MRAATNPGGSGTNGRQGDFSNNFIRMTVGCPVEVLHYHDASLRKETLLRELVPAREAKAALRAQRQLEIVARHEARKQHDAQRRASRRAKAAEEERKEQQESAMFMQRMWRGRGFGGAPARAEPRKLSPEQAARLVQGRLRQHLASKAERTERRRQNALSVAACAIQSYSRRKSAMLRVLNLAAYRKIDEAMAEVWLQLQPRLLSSAATTISRHARGRSTRRLMHARRMLRLGGLMSHDVLMTRAALRIQTLYRGKLARRRAGSRPRVKPAGSRASAKPPGRRVGGSKDAPPKGIDPPTDPSAAAAVPLPPPAAGTWQATPPRAGAGAGSRAGAGAGATASPRAGAGATASPRAGAGSRPGAGASAGAGAGRVPVAEPVLDATPYVLGLAAHPRIGGTAARGADGTPLEKLRRRSRELMADMRLSPERRKAAVEAAQR